MFKGSLKPYQLEGLKWLVNLYEHGINGILADEMGLGKTIQSMCLFAYLAEVKNIWGPFLVVSPASTLHNWCQEIAKFLPDFVVWPYWGKPTERAVLRKFWNPKNLHKRDSPFHVIVTSYDLVVRDASHFMRLQWQYMLLDEAQAVKSSSSQRWRNLLGFKARNRLLLTGTPVQNSMAELWALLHFIMPTIFDSHQEFNEWFSKDIENHAENQTALDEHQLRRLHIILKPFMLRRVKAEVEHELAAKVEVEVPCELALRQRQLYRAIKKNIPITELLRQTGGAYSAASTETLMNLVMQLRKVCNHPQIFSMREGLMPFWCSSPPLVQAIFKPYPPDSNSAIGVSVPRAVYRRMNLASPSTQLAAPSFSPEIIDRTSPLAVTSFVHQHLSIFHPACRMLLPSDEGSSSLSLSKSLSRSDELLSTSPSSSSQSPFSFLRLADMSPGDLYGVIRTSMLDRLTQLDEHNRRLEELEIRSQLGGRQAGVLFLGHRRGSLVSPQRLSVLSAYQQRSLDIRSILLCDVPRQRVIAAPPFFHCSDRHFVEQRNDFFRQCASYRAKLQPFISDISDIAQRPQISVPLFSQLVADSGKLRQLDDLLSRLKAEGHRVLIYSQMTKMIDILEDFLTYRQHRYIRLDGSSSLSDRRDLVADFQTRSEIFVFLLSTRAGGLGINLTAADTVIFYDSDWNPTMDAQAMDRAHRLGQTRQVTVYRLITKNTIEERIIQRAKQKHMIQSIVIAGSTSASGSSSGVAPSDVVSLLLGDPEDDVSSPKGKSDICEPQTPSTTRRRGFQLASSMRNPSQEKEK